MATEQSSGDAALNAVVWDLEPIVDGGGDDGARALIAAARQRAEEFAATYAGQIGDLDPAEFVAAVRELAEIRDLGARFDSYTELRASVDPTAGALRAAAETALADIDAELLCFEMEWLDLDDVRAEDLLKRAVDEFDFAVHYLRRLRARRPYLLSAAEERLLAETRVPRSAAWKRLYTQSTGALTVQLDGETAPLSAAITGLFSPDAAARHAAMDALGPALAVGLDTRVAVYNQVLGERAVDDRLRGYPTWLSSRNLANETTDAAVEAQLAAVAARGDLMQRWLRCKAGLLDLERLRTADLYAPLPSSADAIPFPRAREIVVSSWNGFSEHAAATIDRFFSEGRIDAPLRPGKPPGAFCHSTSSGCPAYVLVNYNGRPTDVMALAHELGHGLHHELNRSQGPLQRRPSIPMLEVASTFSEALVFETLIVQAASDRDRLNLLAARIDDAIGNVFITSAYCTAEAAMHNQRRAEGELSADQITELWVAAIADACGDAVDIDTGFRLWWSFIPHMIESPGYLYSYSYGLLTAWSAYARYREVGTPFVDEYLAMLAAGGSRSPKDLLAMIGLDVDDPGHWKAGLSLLDALISDAEQLAAVA